MFFLIFLQIYIVILGIIIYEYDFFYLKFEIYKYICYYIYDIIYIFVIHINI